MKKLSEDAEKIMAERFGKDTIIALATVENEAYGKQLYCCNSW